MSRSSTFQIRKLAVAFTAAMTVMVLPVAADAAHANPHPNESTAQVEEGKPAAAIIIKSNGRAEAERAAAKVNGRVEREVLSGRNLYEITVELDHKKKDLGKEGEKLVDKLGKEAGVVWATPAASPIDDDRFYAWRFYAWPDGELDRRTEGDGLAPYLDLDTTHRIATGEGVTVAVLDTGFDLDHPMLESQLLPGLDLVDGDNWAGDRRNGIDDDGDGLIDEAHGHGTFVAGIVAQVAPDAAILPIRVLDADGVGQLFAVVEGIDTAVMLGADVINLSFGMPYKSKAVEQAVKRAHKAGVVVVAAAGNDGSKDKQYPAADKEVLSVAAYDRSTSSVAGFGSRGSWIDVSAPGVDIVSARPGGGRGTWSGSSLAAPIVAGQVALIYELSPDKAAKEARKAVRENARKAKKGMKDDVGVIDLSRSLDHFR